MHLNGPTNLGTNTFATRKLKELQCPKIRLVQPLLSVIPTPNFMQIRWTVMEKQCQNTMHTQVCVMSYTVHVHFEWAMQKCLLRQYERSYRDPNLNLNCHYEVLLLFQLSLVSVVPLWRNGVKIFAHTIVHVAVTPFTQPYLSALITPHRKVL